RFDGSNCNGTRSYYKPLTRRHKRIDSSLIQKRVPSMNFHLANFKQPSFNNYNQRTPYEWRKPEKPKQVIFLLC
ncbi:unnamed protein product, partial [Rotaria magnacalcarata]